MSGAHVKSSARVEQRYFCAKNILSRLDISAWNWNSHQANVMMINKLAPTTTIELSRRQILYTQREIYCPTPRGAPGLTAESERGNRVNFSIYLLIWKMLLETVGADVAGK